MYITSIPCTCTCMYTLYMFFLCHDGGILGLHEHVLSVSWCFWYCLIIAEVLVHNKKFLLIATDLHVHYIHCHHVGKYFHMYMYMMRNSSLYMYSYISQYMLYLTDNLKWESTVCTTIWLWVTKLNPVLLTVQCVWTTFSYESYLATFNRYMYM